LDALRPLIAGNWKMNGVRADGIALATRLKERAAGAKLRCDVLLCPPFTLLREIAGVVAGSPLALGAQDCSPHAPGAHTGDIAAAMLRDAGCAYVILGHSERRTNHGETDAQVRAKASAAQNAGLTPIVCVGETEAERDKGQTFDVITRQVEGSLPGGADVVIAYEPVWAIGTGRTPNAADIAAAHRRIAEAARSKATGPVKVLYGGSVNAANASALLAIPEVNGALVGGASLKPEDFWTIVQSCP
jgi:triosephosphate isomerase